MPAWEDHSREPKNTPTAEAFPCISDKSQMTARASALSQSWLPMVPMGGPLRPMGLMAATLRAPVLSVSVLGAPPLFFHAPNGSLFVQFGEKK